MENNDIMTEADIKTLVDRFYEKVNNDELLSPIFNDFAAIDWEHHLPVMYSFWGSILLGNTVYRGQPFPKHLRLPIQTDHFDRWLALFIATVNENFSGYVADEAKLRASNIATIFQIKMGLKNRFSPI